MKRPTKISWATYTTNIVVGCHKPAAITQQGLDRLRENTPDFDLPANLDSLMRPGTSPECIRCYAESLATRYGWTKQPWQAEHAAVNVRLHPERAIEWSKVPVKDPRLRPSERERFFVCSMGDIFHERVPDEFLRQQFRLMRQRPHIYMLLTKRIERAASRPAKAPWLDGEPWPPNVWLGTTVGHPNTKWRIDFLRESLAPVRFVSMEPLTASLTDRHAQKMGGPLDLHGVDQIIVGGESGIGWRPMDMQWARDLQQSAAITGTAFFFKQDAAIRPGIRPFLVDGAGKRWEYKQFPGELTPPREIDDAEVRQLQQGELSVLA